MMPTLAPHNPVPAIASANAWVLAARPIIRAMVELSDGQNAALEALYQVEGRYTRDEARGYIDTARAGLFGVLDGIRDEFLCDERRSTSFEVTDAEAEAADQFNDELDDGVTSVADAVRMVEREMIGEAA